MPNLILGALSCAACIAFGFGLRSHYKTCYTVVADYCDLVAYIGEQITYRLSPLPDIMADFARVRQGALARALSRYPEVSARPPVPAETWNHILSQIGDLGRSDLAGQASRLAQMTASAVAMREEAQSKVVRGNLYAKLCVLGGVALMIAMM